MNSGREVPTRATPSISRQIIGVFLYCSQPYKVALSWNSVQYLSLMIRNMNGLELPCRVERRRARYQHIFGKSRHTLWPSLPDIMLYSIQHVEDIGGHRVHNLSCLVIILWSRQRSERRDLVKTGEGDSIRTQVYPSLLHIWLLAPMYLSIPQEAFVDRYT